jgi:HlyD family secretion protein
MVAATNGTSTPNEVVKLERAPLSVTIGAIGNVRPAQSAVLVWQTSGKVGKVNVVTGQKVSLDETLATLDPASLPNNILQAQVDLINARNALDDLMNPDELALAQAEEALKQAQDALADLRNPSETAIAQAELAVIDAQNEVDDEEYRLNSLINGRGSKQQIELARANYLLAQEKVNRMEQIYNNTGGESDEDAQKALALSNLEGAKRERDKALASVNWYLGKPSEAEMAEAQTNLALAQAKLADAQQTLQDLQEPSATAIALAEAEVADAQEQLDKLRSGPTEDDLTIAQTRLTQAQATVNLAQLTAPIAGTVTEIAMLKGDLVSAGSEALRIDDLSSLYLDLQVSEIDMPLITIGQPVNILFDAIANTEYFGEVDSIGQVGTSIQNVVNFTVTVRLTNPDEAIKPGMTAEANIQIAQVEDVLQLPNRLIYEDNGRKFVYRLNDEASERIYIQVGFSSDSASEVISDELQEGDLITTRPDFPFGQGQEFEARGGNGGPGGGDQVEPVQP